MRGCKAGRRVRAKLERNISNKYKSVEQSPDSASEMMTSDAPPPPLPPLPPPPPRHVLTRMQSTTSTTTLDSIRVDGGCGGVSVGSKLLHRAAGRALTALSRSNSVSSTQMTSESCEAFGGFPSDMPEDSSKSSPIDIPDHQGVCHNLESRLLQTEVCYVLNHTSYLVTFFFVILIALSVLSVRFGQAEDGNRTGYELLFPIWLHQKASQVPPNIHQGRY